MSQNDSPGWRSRSDRSDSLPATIRLIVWQRFTNDVAPASEALIVRTSMVDDISHLLDDLSV
jgi:hypothetical protein